MLRLWHGIYKGLFWENITRITYFKWGWRILIQGVIHLLCGWGFFESWMNHCYKTIVHGHSTMEWISFMHWLINTHLFCIAEWKVILRFILCSALKHKKETSCLRDAVLMIQYIRIHCSFRDLCALLCIHRNAYMGTADTVKWKKNKLLCCQCKKPNPYHYALHGQQSAELLSLL